MSQRYFLDELNQVITGQDAHHIKKVMRMKTGDEIIVCAQKKCFLASIEINDDHVTYQTKEELKQPSKMDVTLIQGLPKGSKNDFVVKYATIFNASKIILTPMSGEKSEAIDQWLDKECQGQYTTMGLIFVFERQQDAAMFALTFI